jgi:single-stranded-DNA-specific exonuclease
MNRGIRTVAQAEQFLWPETIDLPSPLEELTDLPLSLELLAQAIQNQDPIAICGDYDADGMTSTALLLRALRGFGAVVNYAIPSRMTEGYGLNERIVQDFHQEGVKLILTVDNGIAAHRPIALARSLGLGVIVTDHHDLPPELPLANAILNPKLLPLGSLYRGLAGVGVAYVLAVSLAQHLQQSQDFVNAALALFTLGTVADMAPLVGVNRRWVKRGLAHLPHTKVPGIQALIQVAGLKQSETDPLKPDDIGFQLGPRINAIGRMENPQLVIDLLTTEDFETALALAQECETTNEQRRQLTEEMMAQALAQVEEYRPRLQEDRVLLLVGETWHKGIVGLVASRMVERYGVPVFMATANGDKGLTGSARGIPEFNVFEALEFCKAHLTHHGGHRAAGGFALLMENLDAFRQGLIEFANRCLELEHLKPLVMLDGEATLGDLTWQVYHEIDSLNPWGIENPEPIFWSRNLEIVEQKTMGDDRQHIRLTLRAAPNPSEHWEKSGKSRKSGQSGKTMQAVFWQGGRYSPLPSPVDVAFHLKENTWNGESKLQLEIKGIRLSPCPFTLKCNASDQKASFVHNNRPYDCRWCWLGESWELRIRNDQHNVLAIAEGAWTGLLGQDRASAKTVDLRQGNWQALVILAQNALFTKT